MGNNEQQAPYLAVGWFLPIQHPNGIWVSHAQRDQLDVSFCKVLLLQTVHCTLSIFLQQVDAARSNLIHVLKNRDTPEAIKVVGQDTGRILFPASNASGTLGQKIKRLASLTYSKPSVKQLPSPILLPFH